MSIPRKYQYALVLFIVLLPVAAVLLLLYRPQSDTLWRIVSQQCLPHQSTTGVPTPCARVDTKQGYVLLKDRKGILQYLLLPTRRNSGIEDPQLLNPATPNYLAAAWHNRDLLSQRYGSAIPDRLLSLTINSRYGRTQDQLHIHLSCTRQHVVTDLWRIYPTLRTQWRRIGDIEGKRYWARRLSNATLERESPFILLAQLAGTPDAMADYGLALLPAPDGQLILLATRRALWRGNLASIETIQDHRCPQLYPQSAGTP
ncbi:CDP-diacylglycerol diphosphatase [Edwardsiella tarda]|uniref:CDP-diacylglycerol diphosphatase n=1 Tax=Edwardsiella tarda TaxID=636 RepID=UPI0019676105|nr:CDP-diacylglycerol diphosphatase [Edwardsiella tarda]